ncbi:hypothetical protein [Pseudooceanicola sp. LIPI14-2-Ac024]|uniref:hypothetical protein n=1 Tax=Pseudooceanicola sp. LIPI14-2-Ac024 TaxID=3344875 RepID=UPI0035D01BE8
MTDKTPTDQPPETPLHRAEMSVPLAAIGLAATVATPLFIDYWIVKVRWDWMEAYPDRAAARPPTISRAMADIPLGEQLGIWLSICALIMVVAAAIVSLLYLRTLRALPGPHQARRRIIWIALAFLIVQIPVSAGIILQGIYSLSVSNDLHMAGSYLLFVAAGAAQVVCILVTSSVLAVIGTDPTLREAGLIHPGAARLRAWVAGCGIAIALGYLALFVLKDTAWSSPALYQAYVTTEVVLIVVYMGYLMLHGIDFARILMRHGRSASASRTPASRAEGP